MRCIVRSDGCGNSVSRSTKRFGHEKNMEAMRPIRWSTLVLLLCLVLLSGCGGPWRDRYLDKGVKTLTQDDIAEKFGPPHTSKTPVLGGDLWLRICTVVVLPS